MIHIENLREGTAVFDALNSEVRITIIELLLTHGALNLDFFAKNLGLSNGAITMHIRKLAEANLIQIKTASGKRGSQKMCHMCVDKIIINIEKDENKQEKAYKTELGIGHYTNFQASPTCGIVTATGIIGEFDDPRYFSFPQRFNAELLWFSTGYLEYFIPNNLKIGETLTEFQISMELASEAPGYSTHYPSDIYFSVNNVNLGYWTSPGEFNDRRGIFTPDWWFPNLGQYGKLKLLTVNKEGSYIDGMKISDVTVNQLKIDSSSNILFRISAPKECNNQGGLSLFGKGFGDYNMGLTVKLVYENTNGNTYKQPE